MQEGRRGARHGHFSNCEDPRVGMEPVVATAVHAAEPNPNVAPVIAAAAVVTAVAEVSIAAVPMVIVEGAAVPMVTAVAEASTIDDIPEATAEVVFVTSPAAADGAGEKRGRKSGTKVPRWTPEEEVRLRALVEELGEKDWTSVAGRLETGRSPAGVEQHWQIMSGKRKRNGEALTKKKTDEDGTGEAGEAGAAGAEGEPTLGSTAEKKAAKALLRAEKEASKATKSAAKEERAAEKAAEKESKEAGLAAKRAAKVQP